MYSNFCQELNKKLLAYYGRVPSATVLSRDFNLRAKDVPTISQESARRWIRGLSIPESNKLQLLIEWLDLDPLLIFPSQTNSEISELSGRVTSQLNAYELLLVQIFRETDTRGKQILLSVAKTLLTENRLD
jgi:hypothetical protein